MVGAGETVAENRNIFIFMKKPPSFFGKAVGYTDYGASEGVGGVGASGAVCDWGGGEGGLLKGAP